MKVGDTVKLKSVGTRTGKPTTAVVQRIRKDGAVLLDRRIADFQWWHSCDLTVVKLSAKERVLAKYPKAIAKYVGLSLKIVIGLGFSMEISGRYVRERDAWASAARRIGDRHD